MKKKFQKKIKIPINQISKQTSSIDIAKWDSLTHFELLLELEKKLQKLLKELFFMRLQKKR